MSSTAHADRKQLAEAAADLLAHPARLNRNESLHTILLVQVFSAGSVRTVDAHLIERGSRHQINGTKFSFGASFEDHEILAYWMLDYLEAHYPKMIELFNGSANPPARQSRARTSEKSRRSAVPRHAAQAAKKRGQRQ